MLTATKFARRFGLSRTALLYYESIGLLKPPSRTQANYRCYGEREIRRLEEICMYRGAGVALLDILRILDGRSTDASRILERRLGELHAEIERLRNHQHMILKLLRIQDSLERVEMMTKDKFVGVLKAAGFGEAEMHRFHTEFERSVPEEHQAFLEYLHIPDAEIQEIRELSRSSAA
ncbi:MAG: MerR family DNA-binding transcriptional regulator [Acidobacteria bacterium]|nr:MerR family DNA-binding transcriptional regulator [Acidobacteriota bacterium]